MSKSVPLFEFAIPTHFNDGVRSYADARAVFERKLIDIAGGYTLLGGPGATSRGYWADAKGKIYGDNAALYRVATTRNKRDQLLREAAKLFPDQLAFFVAEIGTGTIVERDKIIPVGVAQAA